MKKWALPIVAIMLVLGAVVGGVSALNRYEDRQYRRFCIEHQTDQGRCNSGPAAEFRRRCDRGELPPVRPVGVNCVQAWFEDK